MVKHWFSKSWPFVLAGGILAVLAFPHLVSAYHLEAGGRAVDDLELLSYNAPAALEHLQKAIEWQPDSARAYRLMGKVYRAQGDKILDSKSQGLVAAAEALTRYTELRPDNPLGHIELAEVYEAIKAEMQAMRLADLVAALPQAAVDTSHTRPGDPAWRSYIATTAFWARSTARRGAQRGSVDARTGAGEQGFTSYGASCSKRLSIIQLLDVLDGEIPKGEQE